MQPGDGFAIGISPDLRDTVPMKIRLEYMAMVQLNGPASGSLCEVAENSTAGALLHALAILPRYHPVVTVFVNDIKVSHTRILAEGDRVFLSIPMGGG